MPYLTKCNLLKMQDLWLAYHQMLLIILLKEFVKLSANIDMTKMWN